MTMHALIFAIALTAPAPAPTTAPLPNFTSPDAAFYRKAAEDGIAEVELGNLAQQKSANPSVKEFGALVVSEDSVASEKLRGVAGSKNIKLPTKPSWEQRAAKSKLETLSGDAFDKTYVNDMIKDHEDNIRVFSKESSAGEDPDAKAYAAATLPTLQAHLAKLKQIAASTGNQ
jgi:putative membrane protein